MAGHGRSIRPSDRKPESSHPSPTTAGIVFLCIATVALLLFGVIALCGYFHGRRHRTSSVAVAVQDAEARRASAAAKPPAFAYGQSDGPQCSVCLNVIQVGETARLLPVCKHLYHAECIDLWLSSHSTCPLCRSEIDPLKSSQTAPREPPRPRIQHAILQAGAQSQLYLEI